MNHSRLSLHCLFLSLLLGGFLTVSLHAQSYLTPMDPSQSDSTITPESPSSGVILVFQPSSTTTETATESSDDSTQLSRRAKVAQQEQTQQEKLSNIPGLRLDTLKKTVRGTLNSDRARRASQSISSAAARNLDNMFHVEVENPAALDEVIAELSAHPDVLYAEPDHIVYPMGIPNDAHFSHLWGLNNTGQMHYDRYSTPNNANPIYGTAGADIKWTDAYGEPYFPTDEVIVAVIDTGVDYTHPDLAQQMWVNQAELNGSPDVDDDGNGYVDDIYGIDPLNGDSDPFDDAFHGTHCAGTIAARGENNLGIIGVNPNAKIMALKFLGSQGGSLSNAIECIRYAVDHGAKVLNNSWGGGAYSQALQDAITYANEQGVLFVAAAGNNGMELKMYPAAYSGVLCVGSTDAHDIRSSFSNYGAWVDVVAPGSDVVSTRSSSYTYGALGTFPLDSEPAEYGYLILSGTSMATPHVAGLASLLYAQHPGKPAYVYESVIKATADASIYAVPGNAAYQDKLGTGRLDVDAALTHNAVSAFFAMGLNLEEGMGAYGIAPGQTLTFKGRIATWAQAVDNLSVHITNHSSGIQVTGNASFSVGTVDAFEVFSIGGDAFEIQIKSDAAWGSTQSITFELRSGADVLATDQLNIGIYDTKLTSFVVEDLEGDGYAEVIGERGGMLYSFTHDGQLNWVQEANTQLGAVIQNMITGDFNGNGQKDIAVFSRSIFGGGNQLSVYDASGVKLKEVGHSDIYNATQLTIVHNLNGGNRDYLVLHDKGADSVTHQIKAFDVDAMLEGQAGSGHLFSIDAYDATQRLSAPAVGDIDGDGALEIVFIESSSSPSATGQGYVRVYDLAGTFKKHLPLPKNINWHINFLLGDVNADGTLEAVIQGYDASIDYYLHCVNLDTGKILEGYPKKANMMDAMALGDIDLDGDLEIVGTASSVKRVYAWHHTGELVDGFPVFDVNLIANWSLAIADINADYFPDIIYNTNRQLSQASQSDSYQVNAIDGRGLSHHGYPITLEQNYTGSAPAWFSHLSVYPLAPSYDGSTYNAFILSICDAGIKIIDTGMLDVPELRNWAGSQNNKQKHRAHLYDSIPLEARFVSTGSENGYGSLAAQFRARVTGRDQDGLLYHWDFNNDGTFEIENSTNATPSHSYSSEGTFSVRLVVTNTAGESFEYIQQNYITVYPASGVVANFSANTTTGNAPLTVHFTDESLNGATTWAWDFNNDGITDSTEQNPSYYYSTSGNFTVRLTVTAVGGGSNTVTQTNYIQLGEVQATTTRYVSHNGSHSHPFKNWNEAAHSLQAAIDVANPGDTIIVDDGVFELPASSDLLVRIDKADLTIRSRNGKDHTILDGAHRGRVLKYEIGAENIILEGFTIRNGYAINGAAIIANGVGNFIRNCKIIHNTSTQLEHFTSSAEGVIYMGGIASSRVHQLIIEDTVIAHNRSYSSSPVVTYLPGTSVGGYLVMERCVIHDNYTTGEASGTTGQSRQTHSVGRGVTLRNSLLYNNRGGISVVKAASIDNCTIVDNESTMGAIDAPVVRNTVVAFNSGGNWVTQNWSGSAWVNKDFDDVLIYDYLNNLSSDNPTGTAVVGSVQAEPTFVDRPGRDYRLTADSRGVDEGLNWRAWQWGMEWSALFDFGTAGNTTPGNWNNLTTLSQGTVLTNAVKTDGQPSSINLNFSATPTHMLTGGPDHDTATPPVPYPSSAQSDAFGFPGYFAETTISFQGLNPSDRYSIVAFASGTESYISVFTLAPYNARAIAPEDPSGAALTWDSISPDPSGHINVEVRTDGAGGYATVSGFEIGKSGKIYEPTSELLNWTDLQGKPRVFNNATVDIGAYEYLGNLTPTAKFSWSGDMRVNQVVTFDGAASFDADGSITDYAWYIGASVTPFATTSTTAHTFTETGHQTIRLLVTDNQGLTTEVSHVVEIIPSVPDAPSGLAVTSGTQLPVALSWSDNSSDETGFRIERLAHRFPEIDIIVDDAEGAPTFTYETSSVIHNNVTYVGEWRDVTGGDAVNSGAYGDSYQYTYWESIPVSTVRPEMTAHVSPILPESGEYEVYVWTPSNTPYFPMSSSIATNWTHAAEIQITTENGTYSRYHGTNMDSAQWVSLGVFEISETPLIQVRTEKSTGRLPVDAFRFRKIENYTPIATVPANTTTFTDATSLDGKTYTYRIVPFNGNGDGIASNTASVSIAHVSTAPEITLDNITPASLTGNAPLVLSATVSATDSDGSVERYEWDFGDGYVGSRQQGESLTDATFTYRYPGTYTLKVRAIDNDGYASEYVTQTIVVTGAIPNPPTALSVTQNGGETAVLTWEDNSTNEEGFQIQRRIDGGTFEDLANVGVSVTEFIDTAILPSSNHGYRIRTHNQYVNSTWSNVVAFDSLDMSPPVIITPTVLPNRDVRLDWTGIGADVTHYSIERRNAQIEIIVDNTDTGETSAVGVWASSTTVDGFYGPNYAHDGDTDKGNRTFRFTPVIEHPGNYTAYTWYAGSASRADNIPFTVVHDEGQTTYTVNQQINSAQWVLLGTHSMSNGSYIEISNAETSGWVIADAIRIVRGSQSEWTEVGTVAGSTGALQWTDTVTQPDAIYEYRIRSHRNDWTGAYSNPVLTSIPSVQLSPPTTVATSNISANELTLNWTNTAIGNDGTRLERRPATVTPTPALLDNSASSGITTQGTWNPATSLTDYEGSNYFADTIAGKGTSSLTYTPNQSGERTLALKLLKDAKGDDRIPVTITHTGGTDTVFVNQSTLQTPNLSWDFRGMADAQGITAATNAGTQSGAWTASPTGVSILNSALRVRASTTAETYVGGGTLGYTSGIYTLEVDIPGWNMPGTTTDQWFQLSFNTDNNANLSAGLAMTSRTNGFALFGRALGTGETSIGSETAPVKLYPRIYTGGVTLRLVADFTAQTFQIFYRDADTNGEFVLGSSGGISTGVIDPTRKGGSIRLRMSGAWNTDSNEYFDIARIRVLPGAPTGVPVTEWSELGTYTLDPSSTVTVGTTATYGEVRVDALSTSEPTTVHSWTPLATLAPSATSYADSGLSASTGYEYRFQTYAGAQDGAWSSSFSVTTAEEGSNPTNDYAAWRDAITWGSSDDTTTGDPDADRLTNFAEYALRLDPLVSDATDAYSVSQLEDSGTDYLALTFTRNRLAEEVRFIVQTSTDLSAWTTAFDFPAGSDITATTNVEVLAQDADTQTIRVRIPMTETRHFIRLHLTTL